MTKEKQRKTGKAAPALLSRSDGSFVGCCDSIMFGVQDGQIFHTARKDWPKEDMVRWANANAMFFQTVADKLRAFAAAAERQKDQA